METKTQKIFWLHQAIFAVILASTSGGFAKEEANTPEIKYYAQADLIFFYGLVQVREPDEKAGDDFVEAGAAGLYRVFEKPKVIPADVVATISEKLFKNDAAAEKQIMDGPIMGSFAAFVLFDAERKPVAIVTQTLSVYYTSSLRAVSGSDTFQMTDEVGAFSFCFEMDALVGTSLGPKSIVKSPYLKWLGKPDGGPLPPLGPR